MQDNGLPWEPINAPLCCSLDVDNASWEEWLSECGKTELFKLVKERCGYVRPKLISQECTSCLSFLNRLEAEEGLSYNHFVERLSYTNESHKNEEFSIVALTSKITKDVNRLVGRAISEDVVADYLDQLRNYARENVPSFSKLGRQKDRARVSGVIYQLTIQCGDPHLADLCFLYSLLNYNEECATSSMIGHAVAYLFCSYRLLQRKVVTHGDKYEMTAVHVAVMQEDYHGLAFFPYRVEDFWKPAGYSQALPMELALYNASVKPSTESVLTFLVTCMRAGLLDITLHPLSWQPSAQKRVEKLRKVLTELLRTGMIYKSAEAMLRAECFFGSQSFVHTAISTDGVLELKDPIPKDCTHLFPEASLYGLWEVYVKSVNDTNFEYDVTMLLEQIVSSMVPEKDFERNVLTRNIANLLLYEGSLDYVRKFLKPQHMHVTGKLPDAASPNTLVSLCDVRFILRCDVFASVFAVLVRNAPCDVQCKLLSPHCLFHVTDLYTHMMLCKFLNTNESLISFYIQCMDAKKQLSGNGVRHKKRKWEEVKE